MGTEFFEFLNPVEDVYSIVPLSFECDSRNTAKQPTLVCEILFDSCHHHYSGDELISGLGGGEDRDHLLDQLSIDEFVLRLFLRVHVPDERLDHEA